MTLLRDATLWEILNRILGEQVVVIKTLQESYMKKEWAAVLHERGSPEIENQMELFGGELGKLDRNVQEKLKILMRTSQDLIQLVY
jgi:hypothetical protein